MSCWPTVILLFVLSNAHLSFINKFIILGMGVEKVCRAVTSKLVCFVIS